MANLKNLKFGPIRANFHEFGRIRANSPENPKKPEKIKKMEIRENSVKFGQIRSKNDRPKFAPLSGKFIPKS